MTPRSPGLGTTTSAVLPISTALLAAAIFVIDVVTPAETPMGALYAIVVLVASRFYRADGIIVVAAACTGLVLLSSILTPLFLSAPGNETTERINDAVGIAVIGLTSFLVLQGQAAGTALRESEKEWREVFDHNPIMYFMVDPAGTILSVNAFGAEQLGYTVGELEGRSAFKLFLESDREIAQRNVALCVENHGQSYSWEARKSRKDGSVVWVRENAKAVRRSGNELIVLISCEDITERKRAEAALRASEERWRRTFEFSSVGMAAIGPDRRFMVTNPAFQRMVGYTGEELRALTPIDITHEDDRAITDERVAEFLSGRRPAYVLEKRYRRKDGSVIWADLSTFSVPATESTPAFFCSIVVDITERKRAEEALRQSEAYLTEVFKTLPDGVAVVGRDYRYLRVNPTYDRRTGLRSGQIVGMHVADINGVEAFNETIKPELDRCFAGKHVAYGQWFTHAASGRRYLHVTYSPLFTDDENRSAAALAITRDLTEHMLAQEALLKTQAELARMHRITMLGTLAASIAHEINQPLAAVVTDGGAGLRWLGGEPANLAEARQALARIVKSANRAADVIGRIRALAKRSPIQTGPVNINELILEVIGLTRGEVDRNGVALRTQLADGLPSIQGDRIQLQQVILNLVMNAIEAVSGGEPRELRIASAKDGSQNVVVSVGDSGPGLDPASVNHIFDTFYSTKSDGMGMGLAISRSIVESHGGRL